MSGARRGRFRVTGGRDDDTGGARVARDASLRRQAFALGHGEQQRGEVFVHGEQQRLGLGIAEAHVELEHLRRRRRAP